MIGCQGILAPRVVWEWVPTMVPCMTLVIVPKVRSIIELEVAPRVTLKIAYNIGLRAVSLLRFVEEMALRMALQIVPKVTQVALGVAPRVVLKWHCKKQQKRGWCPCWPQGWQGGCCQMSCVL